MDVGQIYDVLMIIVNKNLTYCYIIVLTYNLSNLINERYLTR